MTKLEAVNEILEGLGNEAPATSLDTGGTSVVAEAEVFLDRYSKRIQRDGWHVNEICEKEYTPDGSGHIDVAANVLKVTPSPYTTVHIRQVGTRIWNATENTDVWTDVQKFNIVEELAYTDLPIGLSHYITAFAAMMFARFKKRSVEDDAFLRNNVEQAYIEAVRERQDQSAFNMLATSDNRRFHGGRYPNQQYGHNAGYNYE